MLKISLHQFRCWNFLELNIQLGAITLIKGSSGIGKSTIFQAIYWGLYGNVSSVAPNNAEKSNTSVTIELPYNINGIESILKICRQRNPKRLIVSHNNNINEDKVAQSLIDNLFGTDDIWFSSCYIGQGTRNKFLTNSNNGKMELLNTISFNQEDPSKYIDIINDNIGEITIKYNVKLQEYNNNLSTLQNLLKDVDLNNKLSDTEISNIKSQIVLNNQKLIQLSDIKKLRDINIGIIKNLDDQLSKIIDITIPIAND
jgi:DNA repair exonuclease SbcCD ATPase subunit